MSEFKIQVDAELNSESINNITEQLKNQKIKIDVDVGNANSSSNNINNNLKDMAKNAKDASAGIKSIRFDANQENLIQRIKTHMAQNTKAVKEFKNEYNSLLSGAEKAENQFQLGTVSKQFSTLQNKIKETGKYGQTLGSQLKDAASKFSNWIGVSTLVMSGIHSIQNAFGTIVQLDDAMIELKKVAEATNEEFNNFYYTSNEMAKYLGQTTQLIIQQTAVWAQLGFTIKEASNLAKESSILSTISPEMTTEQATESLISTIKAYDVDVNNVRSEISDKINIIGNTYAIDNSAIAEILNQSASAMKAANNTLEENIALGTAAQEIVQDDNRVGNALKTISMRIRGLNEETEQYDATLETVKGSVAEATGKSVFTDETKTEYKSTYQILKDIAEVWDSISDTRQAALAEDLFGKQRANVGLAILNNFETAEKAMQTMSDSAGSADREFEKAQQGISYKLNALKETSVGVWQNLIDSDAVKLGVDTLTSLLSVVDKLTDSLGGLGSLSLAGAIGLAVNGKGWVNEIEII